MNIHKEEMPITLIGKETVEIVERLCAITGMTAPCLVALLVRKYGKDFELWLGNSPSPPNHDDNKPTIELPTDPGENLTPIEL
ncbi:MAG: hypothetical protein ABFS56_19610 [Pseudomonadota bacterium]